MPPFVLGLLSQGLSYIANLALNKGADYVKEKTGVDITAPQLSEQDLLTLKQHELENEHELQMGQLELDKYNAALLPAAINLVQTEDSAVTSRWQADTGTDSWLAKNVRPITLIYILSVFTVLAVASAGWHKNIPETYLTLLGQWGSMILTAYFGGRSLEKIITTIKSNGAKNGNQ